MLQYPVGYYYFVSNAGKVEEVAATMSMEVVSARMRMVVLYAEKSSWLLYKRIYELMINIYNDNGNGVLSRTMKRMGWDRIVG